MQLVTTCADANPGHEHSTGTDQTQFYHPCFVPSQHSGVVYRIANVKFEVLTCKCVSRYMSSLICIIVTTEWLLQKHVFSVFGPLCFSVGSCVFAAFRLIACVVA